MDRNKAAVDNATEKPAWEQLAEQSRDQRMLVLDDDSEFVVPADLLGMHSSFFRNLLFVDQKDDKQINLRKVRSDVFELFLKSLCGLPLTVMELTKVCRLAHRFNALVLVKTCDDVMFSEVKAGTLSALVPLSIAEQHSWLDHCDRYTNLYSSFLDFTDKNAFYEGTVKDATKAWVFDRFIPNEAAKARHYDEIVARNTATETRPVYSQRGRYPMMHGRGSN